MSEIYTYICADSELKHLIEEMALSNIALGIGALWSDMPFPGTPKRDKRALVQRKCMLRLKVTEGGSYIFSNLKATPKLSGS